MQRQCLILTGDPSLRQRLQSVAELGGWETCEAPSDGEAVAAAIEPLLDRDSAERQRILAGYGRLRQRLGEPGVTQRAAAAILDSLAPC